MSRHVYQLFFSLCLIVTGQIVQAQNLQRLEPNKPVDREIAGGESHTYQITLQAGQFVRFRLDQRAIDSVLMLTAPDGRQVVEMNLAEVGEQESLLLEVRTPGNYELKVYGDSVATIRGSYRLEAFVKDAAAPADRQRLSALSLLVECKELRKQKEKTAREVIEKGQRALSLVQDLDEPAWTAYSLYLLGAAHSRLNEHDKAIDFYEQGLKLCRDLKLRAREGQLLNNLGLTYFWMNEPLKAITFYEQALAISRELKDRPVQGNNLKNIAVADERLSLYDNATTAYEQALAIAQEVKDRSEEGIILNSLGVVSFSLSQYDKAIIFYERSLVVQREVKDRQQECMSLENLGAAYRLKGEYEQAIVYYEQALAIARELRDRSEEAYALNGIGALYRSLNRFDKAIEYYEQCLLIRREIKDRRGEGTVLNNLGVANGAMNRYDKAIAFYEQSLAIRRELKDSKGEAFVFINLGSIYNQLKQYDKAIAYSEQALVIFRDTKDRAREGYALKNLAIAYGGLRQYEKAIAFGEQGLVIAREIKSWDDELNVLPTLARLESERGNLEQARAQSENSLKVAELLRTKVVSPESRASLLAAVQNSYQLYTDILMRQHKTAPTKGFDALAVESSERQRARSLLDLLTESRTDVRQGVDPALIERERSLAKQLTEKAQQLLQAGKPEQAAALKQEISRLENDYERAQADIRKASPHYAALIQPQPLKLKEIQEQLDPDTLLLEYALGSERSYLWAIAGDSLTGYELPGEEEIKKNALAVYELLTARNIQIKGETVLQKKVRIASAETKLPLAAETLSDILLKPAAARFGNKRLVIVADGALQYIPFAMLPDPVNDRNQASAKNFQPLVVNHEIVSLPSVSALAVQRTELANRQPAAKTLAVMADPVFDRTDARFKLRDVESSDKTPAPQVASADERGLEYIADTNANGRLVIRRLPFTEREATGLLALAPKNSRFEATGFEANWKTAMSGELANYRYVHFATHGLLDTERPGLSALVLSMVDAEGHAQNGFLRANDIYNMKLPAELVVLSACQTGLGKEVKGEGLIGLTRGFMYAGARRVTVSLWSVNDKATAELMEKFYRGMLKDGERPAAALRTAQVEMWKQNQWKSPYYWAAFTMQGEWR